MPERSPQQTEIDALVAAIADVIEGQLVMYTLPANYGQPLGDQTHEDVAKRCAPMIAANVVERVLSPDEARS